MLPYRKTVEEIQAYLNSPDQSQDEKVRELAGRYATACRELNDRLRGCQQMIEQGFRSQALKLAEVEPNLLDTAALLDFTERDEWEELAASYGWDRAYGLKLEAADLVNQAYEIEETLKPLMRQHRRFALSRAPLKQRIEVLRKIAERDTLAPCWKQDLRELELARLNRLAELGRTAVAQSDRALMEGIVSEWAETPWSAPVPRAIATKLEPVFVTLAINHLLPECTDDLVAVRTTADVAACQHVLRDWRQLVERIQRSRSNWQPNEKVSATIDKIANWIQQQTRLATKLANYQQAVFELEVAVQQRRPLHEIQQLEAAVHSFGRGSLPPQTEELVRQYRQQRIWYAVSEAGMAILALIVGVVFLVFLIRSFTKS